MFLPHFRLQNFLLGLERYTLEEIIGIGALMIPFIALSVLALWKVLVYLTRLWPVNTQQCP